MDLAARLEELYHTIMLDDCLNEESREWENARHEILSEAIKDSCNYYGERRCEHEYESEREIER